MKQLDKQINKLLDEYIFEMLEQKTFDKIDEEISMLLFQHQINAYDIDFIPDYEKHNLTIKIDGISVNGIEYNRTFIVNKDVSINK